MAKIVFVFLDGSLCSFSNRTVATKTEMEFKCSPVEKGPVFKGEVNCTGHILWESPHACPYYVSIAALIMHRIRLFVLRFHGIIGEIRSIVALGYRKVEFYHQNWSRMDLISTSGFLRGKNHLQNLYITYKMF